MGLTLDEAIKHAEEIAEENEKSLREWKECKNRGTVGWSDFDKEQVDMSITRCSKCAEEYKQLAEWLKDYKRLLEQEQKTGHWVIDNEYMDRRKTYHYSVHCSNCGFRGDYSTDEEGSAMSNFCPNCGTKMVEPQKRGDAE